jgi:hypothetical protein
VPDPSDAPLPASVCPLCGSDNACGLVAGAGSCWCFTASIPVAALDRVPEAARDRRCICAACAGQIGVVPASPVET